MSNVIRLLIAGFFLSFIATGADAACESERAALNRCEGGSSHPDPLPSCRVTCVPKCHLRLDDGSCSSYELDDFCGINPDCSARCRVRMNDGSCMSYELSDVCTESIPRGC
jgi:hypothetical protein